MMKGPVPEIFVSVTEDLPRAYQLIRSLTMRCIKPRRTTAHGLTTLNVAEERKRNTAGRLNVAENHFQI